MTSDAIYDILLLMDLKNGDLKRETRRPYLLSQTKLHLFIQSNNPA